MRSLNTQNSVLFWLSPDDIDEETTQHEKERQVFLQRWPCNAEIDRRFPNHNTIFACDAAYQNASFADRVRMVFVEFVHITIRDGVDPRALHNCLLQLEEYRAGIADSMPGAIEAFRRFGYRFQEDHQPSKWRPAAKASADTQADGVLFVNDFLSKAEPALFQAAWQAFEASRQG